MIVNLLTISNDSIPMKNMRAPKKYGFKSEELEDIKDLKRLRKEPTRPFSTVLKDLKARGKCVDVLKIGHRKDVYR